MKVVEDDREFNDLKTYEKVRLINSICDYRLTTPDAIDKTAVSISSLLSSPQHLLFVVIPFSFFDCFI